MAAACPRRAFFCSSSFAYLFPRVSPPVFSSRALTFGSSALIFDSLLRRFLCPGQSFLSFLMDLIQIQSQLHDLFEFGQMLI